MKLHRLVLTNYRGITHREIEFPDRGVVIVSGANEIGKSSMIEALDLLLEAKDRSSKKEVKQVKPTHADVGAEISAEISTGPYRFVYRKRFHKRAETELTVLAPVREQHTGDEAHDRVRAMLDETVDTCLWQAQRVLQAAPTAAVDLSGCDALSRALDVAAGEAVELSGAEPLLIDRVEAEYLRYFTRTGRPTAEWAAATNRLRAADDELARRAAAVAEVDDAVRRHAALAEDLAALTDERAGSVKRLAAAQAAADSVAELRRQLKEAELVAAAADAGRCASLAAVTERRRLRVDIDERAAAIAELETAAAEAGDELATAAEVQEAADAAADQARSAVDTGQALVEAARQVVDQLTDRDEADRLAARLSRIAAAHRDLDRAEVELAAITLTADGMYAIEAAKAAVDVATGQVELLSARVELSAISDVELRVDGHLVALDAGQTWSSGLGAPADIEVPGVLNVRVVPGATAAETHAKFVAAQEGLAATLAQGRVGDVRSARLLDQRRRELIAERDRLRATTEALTGDDTTDQLQTRLVELNERQPAEAGLFDVDARAARAELDAATVAHQRAIADCETHRKVAEAAAKQLGDRTTRVTVLREKLTTGLGQIAVARERLATQRATITDDELAANAEAREVEAGRAAALVADVGGELARTAPDDVTAALTDAVRRADELGRRHEEVAEALREVTTQLKVYGTEGRKGQLDVAETEREHAEAQYLQVHRRARAAQLLRSVIARHRDATRLRYVDPFRT